MEDDVPHSSEIYVDRYRLVAIMHSQPESTSKLMKFNTTTTGVSVSSGRGASKTTFEVSFKELDDWARKM